MGGSIVIIGGGPAGLMAACQAAGAGGRVTVVERRERPARKLLITGKGRCNLTNACDRDAFLEAVPRNGRFLYAAFSAFPPAAVMSFFEAAGLSLKVERGSRVFPASDRAADVVDTLTAAVKKAGARIVQGRAIRLRLEELPVPAEGLKPSKPACRYRVTGVELEDGRLLCADKVLIATGGLSYPATGSDGDGYRLAQEAGHGLTACVPSLIPLTVHEGWCAELQGLSLKNVGLTILEKGKKKPVYTDFGEMLFTHFGLSGPMILSASAHLDRPEREVYTALIDLKPALSAEQLDARILKDFEKYKNRDFNNALGDLLPRKLIPVAVRLSRIPGGIKVHQVTKEMRAALCGLLKALPLTVTGFRPIQEAIVTRGGIPVKEVDPGSMESKCCKGLYLAGEVLDLDAYTGGFNLQIAWSTGFLAGKSMAED